MEKAIQKGMDPNKAFEDIFWRKSWMNELTPHQQRRLMEIWANEGPEAMQMYRARLLTEDIHFLYDQAQRAPIEQTALGKPLLKLFTFPRGYTERLVTQTKKIYTGKTFNEKFQALKSVFSFTAGAMVVGMGFQQVTGNDRNPYDPFSILKWGPLGLYKENVELPFSVMGDVSTALHPGTPDDQRKQAINRFTKEIPRMANMWLPFWRHFLGSLDVATGKSGVDTLVLRELIEAIDSEYAVRGENFDVDRTALEAWQRIIAGRGVDRTIRREKAERKKRMRQLQPTTRGGATRGGAR
jgi:hypothetical protein